MQSPDESTSRMSPYQVVLGAELAGLHPRLRAYFSAIPAGSIGKGSGEWDRVGSPRRWLWPALWMLGKAGIAFPVWESGVPFAVRNMPVSDAGRPAVEATRTFSFPRGERVMVDSIGLDEYGLDGYGLVGYGLVDRLGGSRLVHSRLRAEVRGDGSLNLRSTDLLVRVGGRLVRVPRIVAPRVDLVERFDDDRDQQHVSLVITMPLIGRLYEYSGYFTYRVEPRGER